MNFFLFHLCFYRWYHTRQRFICDWLSSDKNPHTSKNWSSTHTFTSHMLTHTHTQAYARTHVGRRESVSSDAECCAGATGPTEYTVACVCVCARILFKKWGRFFVRACHACVSVCCVFIIISNLIRVYAMWKCNRTSALLVSFIWEREN